jgi:hypothetical protein
MVRADVAAKISDLSKMLEVSTASTLHVLRSRFQVDEIYTNMGQILIALNPFKAIEGMYTRQKMWDIHHHMSGELASLPPHIYSTANRALYGLQQGQNQVLLISGESGAGKTETTKKALEFLVAVSRSRAAAEPSDTSPDEHPALPVKILGASPLLEALGNAKTLRNDNSSRFGKFLIVFFDNSFSVCGAWNEVYLLEKSRITQTEAGERSYHIFYQLLYGGSDDIRRKCRFDNVNGGQHMRYLAHAGKASCYEVAGRSEEVELADVNRSILSLGFSPEEQLGIFRTVAAVQHLGNLRIEATEDGEGATVVADDSSTPLGDRLVRACSMLGVEASFLSCALTQSTIRAGSGKRLSVRKKKLKLPEAIDVRNALAKELYNALFLWTVQHINKQLLTGPRTGKEIGVLDIFGFEIFPVNSFEQLCINLTNERLQHHFNRNVFELEMELYSSEGIKVEEVTYVDNQPIIDLICAKATGLFPMLDEEVRIPNGSDSNFQNKFLKQSADHACLQPARSQNGPFTILHFAGPVTYETVGFLKKNRNNFTDDIQALLYASSDKFILQLLSYGRNDLDEVVPSLGEVDFDRSPRKKTSTRSSTVSSGFRDQLNSLMDKLDSACPQYVRCIKSNSMKAMGAYEPKMVFEQLTYSGVFQAVKIQQQGYTVRLTHVEFRRRFHMLHGHERCASIGGSMKQRQHFGSTVLEECKALLLDIRRLWPDIDSDSIAIGKTLVLYKPVMYYKLEHEKLSIERDAHFKCQRCGRGALARSMRRAVFAVVKAIGTTAQRGSLREIETSMADMSKVTTRWLKLFPSIAAVEKAASAAQHLLSFVRREGKIIAEMERNIALMASSAVLRDLEHSLELHRCLKVEVNFPLCGVVHIRGVRDRDLVSAVERRRDTVALAMDIVEHFEVGFETSDAQLLERALQMLQMPALVEGAVLPCNFCATEATAARTKINEWKEEERFVLGKISTCLRKDTGAFLSLEQSLVTVDASELRSVIKSLGGVPSTAASRSYVRAMSLVADMREAVRDNRLDAIKMLIEQHWDAGPKSANVECVRTELPVIFTEMELIRRHMHIALVATEIKTALTAGAAHGPVPINVNVDEGSEVDAAACKYPELKSSRQSSILSAMSTRPSGRFCKYLVDLKQCVAAFDENGDLLRCLPEEALRWIQVAKEIIGLRSALLSYDWLALKTAIEAAEMATSFPTTQNEVSLAKQEVTYHTMLSSMIDEVVSESQWAKNGEIGNVDTLSLGMDSQQVLEQVSMYDFKSSDWEKAIKILRAHVSVRGALRRGGWGAALAEVQGVFESEVVTREGSIPRGKASPVDRMAGASRVQFIRIEDEAHEERLLASLREALQSDNMEGRVGAVYDSKMSTVKLDACLLVVSGRQQKSRMGASYVFAARTLRLARNRLTTGAWSSLPEEIGEGIRERLRNMAALERALSRAHMETELLVKEAMHRVVMRDLSMMLAMGVVTGTPSRVDTTKAYSMLEQMRVLLDTSRHQIENECGCDESRNLLQICELVMDIRRNAVEDRWNPAFDKMYGCVNSKELIEMVWRNSLASDECIDRRLPSTGENSPGVATRLLEFGRLGITLTDTSHCPALKIEVALLDSELRDRASRISLTEALARGRVRGNVEEVDYSAIRTSALETAICGARDLGDQASSIVKTLLRTAEVVLEARSALLAHQLVNGDRIRDVMGQCYSGIGHEEMTLILLEARNYQTLSTFNFLLDSDVGRTSGELGSLVLAKSHDVECLRVAVTEAEKDLPTGKMASRLLVVASELIELHGLLRAWTESDFSEPSTRALAAKIAELMDVVCFQVGDEIGRLVVLSHAGREYCAIDAAMAGSHLDGTYEIEFEGQTLGLKFSHSPGAYPAVSGKPDAMELPRIGDFIWAVNGEFIVATDFQVDPFEHMRRLLDATDRPVVVSFRTKPQTVTHMDLIAEGGDAAFNAGLNRVWVELCLIDDEVCYRRLVCRLTVVTSDASTAVKGNPGHLLIDDISSEAVNQVVESTRHTIFERFPAKIPLELQQLIAGAEYTARLRSAIKVSATATSGLLGSNDLAELLRSLPVDKLQEGPESEATLASFHCDHEMLRIDLESALVRSCAPDPHSSESLIPDARSIVDLNWLIRWSRELSKMFLFTSYLRSTIDAAVVALAVRQAFARDDFDALTPQWDAPYAESASTSWLDDESKSTTSSCTEHSVQTSIRAALTLPPDIFAKIEAEVQVIRDVVNRRMIALELQNALEIGKLSGDFATGRLNRAAISCTSLTQALKLAQLVPCAPFSHNLAKNMKVASSGDRRLSRGVSDRPENDVVDDSIEYLIRWASRIEIIRRKYEEAASINFRHGFQSLFDALCTMFKALDISGLINTIYIHNESPHELVEEEFELMRSDICDSFMRERVVVAIGSQEFDEGAIGDLQRRVLPTQAMREAKEYCGSEIATSLRTQQMQEIEDAVSSLYSHVSSNEWEDIRVALPGARKRICCFTNQNDENSFEASAISELCARVSRLADEAEYFRLIDYLTAAMMNTSLNIEDTWPLHAREGTEGVLESAIEEGQRDWKIHEGESLDGWGLSSHPRKFAAGLLALATNIQSMRSAVLTLEADMCLSGASDGFLLERIYREKYSENIKRAVEDSPSLNPGQVVETNDHQDHLLTRMQDLEKGLLGTEAILRMCGDEDCVPSRVIDEVNKIRASADMRACCLGVADFFEISVHQDNGEGSRASYEILVSFIGSLLSRLKASAAAKEAIDLIHVWKDTTNLVNKLRELCIAESFEDAYAELQVLWNMQVPRCAHTWIYATMKEVDIMRLQESCRSVLRMINFPHLSGGGLGWSCTPFAIKTFKECVRVESFQDILRAAQNDPLAEHPSVVPLLFLLDNTTELLGATQQLVEQGNVQVDMSQEVMVETIIDECIVALDALDPRDTTLSKYLEQEYATLRSEVADRKVRAMLIKAISSGAAEGTVGAIDLALLSIEPLAAAIKKISGILVPLSPTTRCFFRTAEVILAVRQEFITDQYQPGEALEAAQIAMRQNMEFDEPGLAIYFWPCAASEVNVYLAHTTFLTAHASFIVALTHGRCDFGREKIRINKLNDAIGDIKAANDNATLIGVRLLQVAQTLREVRQDILAYEFDVSKRYDITSLRRSCEQLRYFESQEAKDLEIRPFTVRIATLGVVLRELRAAEQFYQAHEGRSRLIDALSLRVPSFGDAHYPIVAVNSVKIGDLSEAHSALKGTIVHEEDKLLDDCASSILDLRYALIADSVSAADECLCRIDMQYFPIDESKVLKRWPPKAQEELISGVKALYNYHAATSLEGAIAVGASQTDGGILLLPCKESVQQLQDAIKRADRIPLHYRCEKVESLRESAEAIQSIRTAASNKQWHILSEMTKAARYVNSMNPALDEMALLEEHAECCIMMERARAALRFGALDGPFDRIKHGDIYFCHLAVEISLMQKKRGALRQLHRASEIVVDLEVSIRTCELCSKLRQAVLRGDWVMDGREVPTGSSPGNDAWLPAAGASMNIGWGEFRATHTVEELAHEVHNNGGIGFYASVAEPELSLAQICLECKLLLFHLGQELSIDGPEGDASCLDTKAISTEHLEKVLAYVDIDGVGKDVEALRRDAKIITHLRFAAKFGDWALLQELLNICTSIEADPRPNHELMSAFEQKRPRWWLSKAAPVSLRQGPKGNCKLCHSEYTLYNSEHICQKCGRACCAACSAESRMMPRPAVAQAMYICKSCAADTDHTYDIVFKKQALDLIFEHDALELPIVKVNINKDMQLPAPNDEVIAVNGTLLKHFPDAFAEMANRIKSSARPITLSFRRTSGLPKVGNQHMEHQQLCLSARKEIKLYREFLHYNAVVYELHAALAAKGAGDIIINAELPALIYSMTLRDTSTESGGVLEKAIAVLSRICDFFKLGDESSCLNLANDIQEELRVRPFGGHNPAVYSSLAISELRLLREVCKTEDGDAHTAPC